MGKIVANLSSACVTSFVSLLTQRKEPEENIAEKDLTLVTIECIFQEKTSALDKGKKKQA